jgi:hypothetical protein
MFLQNFKVPAIFSIYGIIFHKKKFLEYVHDIVDRVHRRGLMGLWTSLNVDR